MLKISVDDKNRISCTIYTNNDMHANTRISIQISRVWNLSNSLPFILLFCGTKNTPEKRGCIRWESTHSTEHFEWFQFNYKALFYSSFQSQFFFAYSNCYKHRTFHSSILKTQTHCRLLSILNIFRLETDIFFSYTWKYCHLTLFIRCKLIFVIILCIAKFKYIKTFN